MCIKLNFWEDSANMCASLAGFQISMCDGLNVHLLRLRLHSNMYNLKIAFVVYLTEYFTHRGY